MNRKLENLLVAIAFVVAFFIGAATVRAFGAEKITNSDIEAAQSKAQDTLNSIRGGVSVQSLPQDPDNPNISEVQGRVPVVPDYVKNGQETNTSPERVDPIAIAERARKNYEQIDPSQLEGSTLMVFVSFSMPEESLKRIAYETKKAGGTMFLRGFVNDNLSQTVKASEKLINLGAQIQIHPELFKNYEITQVPAYVLTKAGNEVSAGCNGKSSCTDYVSVVGDGSLKTVLDRMSRSKNSTLASLAEIRLRRFEGL